MKNVIYLIIFLIVSSFKTNENFNTYCNPRFQFCIKYPKDFKAIETPPTNGDGLTFYSNDKSAEILAYGSMFIEDVNEINENFKLMTSNVNVTYKVLKNNYFIFSGTDKKGNIIYNKTVLKLVKNYMNTNESQQVYYNLQISYPASKQAVYGYYCNTIASSFK